MQVEHTPIDGLLVFHLDVHGDDRGWFKENWQREKLLALGLPDFGPVQNNISFNATAGVTRGLHAEPWDKYISVATGAVFGAWCDLREGSATYGEIFTQEITPHVAVFVPTGVANGFQALKDNTAYTYLVNDHWSPDAQYSFVNLNIIDWPLTPTEISDKDAQHPALADAVPVPPKKILVTGADGQLGRALRELLPHAEFVSRTKLDITSPTLSDTRDWAQYHTIINAAAYTAVDQAETEVAAAWAVNAHGPTQLARVATAHNLTLVHISSDYVFDGTRTTYSEDEALAPLGVYGQSKAAGDLAVSTTPRHYILRTSWVVGQGKNFVSTMVDLASRGISPSVVDDQIGRLTFTSEIAAGISHLLNTGAPFGTYNLSNSGDPASWADIAMAVFASTGYDPANVTPVSTADYYGDKPHAPRPAHSTLDLAKITATGFTPGDWRIGLALYLATHSGKGPA